MVEGLAAIWGPGQLVDETVFAFCHWLAGGNTSVNNAVTLCSHHHAAVHIGKWRIRKHNGLTWFQPAPWLDPYQPLLRNLYWNT